MSPATGTLVSTAVGEETLKPGALAERRLQ